MLSKTSSKKLQKWVSDWCELPAVSEAKCPPPQAVTKSVDRSKFARNHCYTVSLGYKVMLIKIKKQQILPIFLRVKTSFYARWNVAECVFLIFD